MVALGHCGMATATCLDGALKVDFSGDFPLCLRLRASPLVLFCHSRILVGVRFCKLEEVSLVLKNGKSSANVRFRRSGITCAISLFAVSKCNRE